MTDVLAMTGRKVQLLDTGWTLALSPPDAWQRPADIQEAVWIPAIVPGTAAMALRALGQWSFDEPKPLHDQDIWYRTRIRGEGRRTLRFEGLATFAEVYLGDQLVCTSRSMFEPLEVEVDFTGEHDIHIAFRSLDQVLAATKGPRARWKTMMIEEPRLRFLRTTLIGHMPGWCPPVDVVGPYRQVFLIEEGAVRATDVHLRSKLEQSEGIVSVALQLTGIPEGVTPVLRCGGAQAPLIAEADARWQAELRIPDVDLWWPHTHGDPTLYDVSIEIGVVCVELGKVGFRRIEVDRGMDGAGFTLRVNGVRVFCRGACWTPIDVVSLQATDADYARELSAIQRAGLNMVRLSGTMVYEDTAFYRLCDAFGILVWQDAMLANFDYPADDAFQQTIRGEMASFIRRHSAAASLAVVCGGSEVGQQAAMMGLPLSMRSTPLADSVIPDVLQERSDVIYVPGSPSGGNLPFVPEAGPSHYFGVGAYCRPLDDARRANVRFASECLAFANLPDDRLLARHDLDPVADPSRWRARVPRDGGASWDFEDTREHYLSALWNVDGRELRKLDPKRWRQLSRAIVAEVVEHTLDEWRRPQSPTAGALVWLWRDFWPGAGWGLLDSDGRPKSIYYGLQRACAPLRLSMTDEGTNGLYVHVINDAPQGVRGKLTFSCLKYGKVAIVNTATDFALDARSGRSVAAFSLLGQFFDAGHCYRFGPALHDTVIATFEPEGHEAVDSFFFLSSPETATEADVKIAIERNRAEYWMSLSSSRTLRFVEIVDDTFVPEDNYFHLAPDREKRIRLEPSAGAAGARPNGHITAINWSGSLSY
jgi:beta-mannosidase